MQEYLRGGDEYKQASEILTLEKRSDYSDRVHLVKIEEREKALAKIRIKIQKKKQENKTLDLQLEDLERSVADRSSIFEGKQVIDCQFKRNTKPVNDLIRIKSRKSLIVVNLLIWPNLKLKTLPFYEKKFNDFD